MDKIKFVTDEGETVEFYVEEQTRVNGTDYLLVTDSMDDEANAYILKDSSEETDPEADYVMVEDDVELEAMSKVFSQMMWWTVVWRSRRTICWESTWSSLILPI